MSLLWKTAVSQVEAARPIPTKEENLRAHLGRHSAVAKHPHEQTLEEFSQRAMWHGSPNGIAGMKVAGNGVHVGSREAARQALEARIGRRADGKDWDGTQEYGKTLLMGKDSIRKADRHPYATGYSMSAPEHDHHPMGTATYGIHGDKVPMHVTPHLFPVHIIGGMTNTPHDPHRDWHANGYMSAQIKQGRARNGYYYRNDGEDAGSISAVVPNAHHLATHEDFVRHAIANPSSERPVHPENLQRYGL